MSNSPWKHRCYIIIPMSSVAVANNLAIQLDPDDGSKTFGDVQLSANGQLPATHTACSTMLTDTGKAGVDQYMAGGAVPGAKVYYEADGWDWTKVLADNGLKVIDVQQ